MAKGNLKLHGDKWHLRVTVPPSLRHMFLSKTGKPLEKIVEPLTNDKAVAKVMAAQRVAECTGVFAQIRAGIITTPEQAKAALQGGYSEPDVALQPGFDQAMHRWYAELASKGPTRGMIDRMARRFEQLGESIAERSASAAGWTISQAAEEWYAELVRDKSTAPRQTTIDGHRRRVQAFVEAIGDLPLIDVTSEKASDFIAGLKVSNRTRNNYTDTLNYIFKYAGKRGRFSKVEEDNPFYDQRSKVGKNSYSPFTVAELQTLFTALPRDPKPAKHTPDTALPWVALIALYTGARLEEIAQLRTGDVREEAANGARVWCIDIHNGGDNKLKNEISARFVPVHSELVRLGLLKYVKALPKGPLFPGLVRRASKGGKIGARIGELFRKKLVALKLKRDGLCFHSFRHNVATALRVAGVPKEDAAPVLGHAVEGESYGTYAQAGPGLINVKATVEKIKHKGLRI
jgi:integrase